MHTKIKFNTTNFQDRLSVSFNLSEFNHNITSINYKISNNEDLVEWLRHKYSYGYWFIDKQYEIAYIQGDDICIIVIYGKPKVRQLSLFNE